MDPASIFGIAASTVSIFKLLLEGSLSLQSAIREIRNIDDSTEELAGELGAFRSILLVFETELQTSELVPFVHRWWDPLRLEELLTNVLKTFSRLEVIIQDVGKERSMLANLRQYWRSKSYDKETSHLRLRIGTYITALQIPIELGKINNIHQALVSQTRSAAPSVLTPRDRDNQRDMNTYAGQILGDRVIQLEESIQILSQGIQSLLGQQNNTLPPTLQQESTQLVEVVQTLAVSTTNTSSQISMASSIGAPTIIHRQNSVHRSVLAGAGREYSPSLHGVPISNQARQRINNWVSEISSDAAPTVSEISGALTEVSLYSEAISTQFSAPSTVRQSSNFKMEVAERRLKKTQELVSQKKYKEAVPHLRRTIEQMNSNPELFTTEIKAQTLQLTLAKTILKGNLDQNKEVEPILRGVLEHEETSSAEKSEAAHYLASVLSENDETRLDEAKDLCEFAVQTRADTFGRDDSKTHQSIALLVKVYQLLQDPDEEIWRDMLPESFTTPSLIVSPPVRTLPQTLHGHSDVVCGLAFSPDGRWLASASYDKSIRLWDAESGAELKTLNGHSNTVMSIAFSPDGRRLASASRDKSIRLWDTESGAELKTLNGHSGTVMSIAFSPDGRRLASASHDKSIGLWDTQSGAVLKTLNGHSNVVASIAFSPNGRWLASASYDTSIRLWDTQSGAELKTLNGHSNAVMSIAFSPDGRWLASASYDQSIRLWDTQSGAELTTLNGHSKKVQYVAFSPDGKLLASGSNDSTVILWDVLATLKQ